MPAALAAQDGKSRARDVNDAPEIRVDLAGEFLRRHLSEGSRKAVSSVVNQHVNSAKCFKGGCNRFFRIGGRGNVQLYGANTRTVAHDEIVELLGPASGGDDGLTGLKDRFSERAAEATRTASNEPDFFHIRLLCRFRRTIRQN